MSKLTINPDDVQDYKTPLYKKDGDKVLRLLPETTADQVTLASGVNLEEKASSLSGDIDSLSSSLATAQATANSAKTTAESAVSQVENLYVNFVGATAYSAGQKGLVPAPSAGQSDRFLCADGSWKKPDDLDTTYGVATDTQNGLMSSGDKIKLDGIQAGAQVNPTLDELGGFPKTGGTITGLVEIDRSASYLLNLKALQVDYEETPTSNKPLSINIMDKNGKVLAQFGYTQYADGACAATVSAYKKVGDTDENAYIRALIDNQGNKFSDTQTPPLSFNSSAIATTKWVNQKLGTGASLAALAAVDSLSEYYVETLEDKKQKAVAEINTDAQQAIYAGFPYEIDGQEYFIGYSLFDQQNLASRAIIASQNPGESISFPCMDDTGHNVWINISAETVLEIQKYGLLSHADVILQAAAEKKTRIWSAETEEQIKAILAE